MNIFSKLNKLTNIYRLCQKLDLLGLSELKVQVFASINEYLK